MPGDKSLSIGRLQACQAICIREPLKAAQPTCFPFFSRPYDVTLSNYIPLELQSKELIITRSKLFIQVAIIRNLSRTSCISFSLVSHSLAIYSAPSPLLRLNYFEKLDFKLGLLEDMYLSPNVANYLTFQCQR